MRRGAGSVPAPRLTLTLTCLATWLVLNSACTLNAGQRRNLEARARWHLVQDFAARGDYGAAAALASPPPSAAVVRYHDLLNTLERHRWRRADLNRYWTATRTTQAIRP